MILCGIVLGVLILVLGGAYCCYRITFRRGKVLDITKQTHGENSPHTRYADVLQAGRAYFAAMPWETVTIRSHDGLKLYGRYFAGAEPDRLVILFHGYRSVAQNDFSCALSFWVAQGFSVLLVDQRAHGNSEGTTIAFGALERFDCQAWIHYAVERFGPRIRILLEGISMGATTVLMASSLPMPDSVCGIIADCGFTSPGAIIRTVIRQMHLPPWLLYPPVRLGARVFGGFDPEKASAPEALRQTKLPVLLIHGEADDFVPCDMSRENYRACASEKELITVPGATHGFSYVVETERVQQSLTAFIKAHCTPAEEPPV